MKPLLTFPCLAAALAAAAPAPSQVSLATDGAVGVYAKLGDRTFLQFLKAKTPIRQQAGVQAGTRGAFARTTAHVRGGNVVVRDTASLAAIGNTENTAGTTASTDRKHIRPGPHCFLMTITGNMAGRITVVYGGGAQHGSKADASVDIGADGKVEFEQVADGRPHRAAFRVQVRGSLAVALCTNGQAAIPPNARGSGYATGLTVSFARDDGGEQPCRLRAFGRPCGATLRGSDRVRGNRHRITLEGTGAFPRGSTVLLVGTRPAFVHIRGIRCPFLAPPVAVGELKADARGRFQRVFELTGPLHGQAALQAVSWRIDNRRLAVHASNGLLLTCRNRR